MTRDSDTAGRVAYAVAIAFLLGSVVLWILDRLVEYLEPLFRHVLTR